MKESGMSLLELEFRILSEAFEEIKKNCAAWGIKIISMHAVCPSPQGRVRGAEEYLISDMEEENRMRGVDQVKQTLRNAADVGARVIILHCGRIPCDEPINIMKKFYDEGKIHSREAEISLREISQNRRTNKGKSFEALLKSLDEINSEAEKLGIDVGLENRYYFFEFPDMNELKSIFSRFNGSKLAYWHDTGHAQVNETLFGISQETLLKTFHNHLIGVHLHDVLSGYNDHNVPGCGTVDFDMVKSYLKPETIRVMEINQKVNPVDAKQGIVFLKDKGIF
jgi:sugar phosphate isomerase/epimerase